MKHTYRRGRKGRYAAPKRNRLNRASVGVVATLAALFIIGSCSDDPADDVNGYVPCVTEDADGPCYWDASERGNGVGRDFIVTPDDSVLYDVPISEVK